MSPSNQLQFSAPIAVAPVREDHLAAIAEAHQQLMELMPIIDAYRFADDTTTFTVDLRENEQQKMLVSPKALTQDINVMNEANPAGDKVGVPKL
ncbi:hypothetical protein G6514_006621 [Epicoccum nigrum]|nr:hypothetical protein G6514_006621 [Epicoccum nigrum]